MLAVLLCLSVAEAYGQDNIPDHWREYYVMANGIRQHFYRTGEDGQPVMILAHGFSDNGLCWFNTAKALEKDYDLILYDARGHGRTDAPETGYTSEDRARDLHGLIEALDVEKPILMGHSMGGSTVLTFAYMYPDIPRAVILEDSGLSSMRPSGAPFTDTRPPAAIEESLKRRREEVIVRNAMTQEERIDLCRNEVHSNWPDPEDCVWWALSKLEHHPNTIQPPGGMFGPSAYEQDPTTITVPLLFLKAETGMRSGQVVNDETRAYHQEQVDAYPNATLHYVKGAGHNVRRERRAAFMEALNAFLESLAP